MIVQLSLAAEPAPLPERVPQPSGDCYLRPVSGDAPPTERFLKPGILGPAMRGGISSRAHRLESNTLISARMRRIAATVPIPSCEDGSR